MKLLFNYPVFVGRISRYFSLLVIVFLSNTCRQSVIFPGYTLIEKRFVKEVDADCYYFEHNQSGAKVFKIASDDPNKTFSITFKTLPESDCGTPHILEHSVLNGSKNFPVKGPFNILRKGSLYTFLNAMTYKDRTMYPGASMNTKDYFNLMHVYFDAVFNPLIYEDSLIFKQEGWHHDLKDINEDISYKGVVYNEMKGSFSNPLRDEYYQVNKQMFPDNSYGFTSGGHPESIPDLTYDQFIAFHKKYYHPSNSYIYLYGDADMKRELAFIDSVYLSKYERSDQIIETTMHEPFEEKREASGYYSVPEGAETNDQSLSSFSYVIGDGTDESLGMALDVLTDVLVNQESAPLRLAFQEAGIGSDVEAWSYGIRQHFFQVNIKNVNPEDKDTIRDIFYQTLNKLTEEGLDKESVEGTINRIEFRLREGDDANKGITYATRHANTWIHAGDPFRSLEYEKPLAKVKEAIKTNYLEQIIRKEIIDNPYALLMVIEPKPGLENEINARTKEKLALHKEQLDESKLLELVKSTEDLIAKQNSEDSPEALATIPVLSIADIDAEAEWFIASEEELAGNNILYLNEFTNSVVYGNYLFDLRVLSPELVPYISILRELLGKLDTEKYTYAELEKALRINTGGFSSSLATYLDSKNNDALIPKMRVSGKVINNKTDKLFELIEEVTLRTDFSDTSRIRNVIVKHHARLEEDIKGDTYRLTRTRFSSYCSPMGLFKEQTGGIEYYWFLTDLLENFENRAVELTEMLEKISSSLFVKDNLMCGFTCDEIDFNNLKDGLKMSINAFPGKDIEYFEWNLDPVPKNEGFMTAAKVQYVIQGANYFDLGYSYNGKVEVLNKVITSDWFRKQVREIGGAYGGGGYFLENGMVYFGSYRDPNLSETLEIYSGTPEFVKNFDTDSIEMTRYIIGSIAYLDYPRTPSQKGNLSISRYLENKTQEEYQKIRDEVLSTTVQDIRSFEPMVAAVVNENIYCISGNQERIEENKKLFKSIETIVK